MNYVLTGKKIALEADVLLVSVDFDAINDALVTHMDRREYDRLCIFVVQDGKEPTTFVALQKAGQGYCAVGT